MRKNATNDQELGKVDEAQHRGNRDERIYALEERVKLQSYALSTLLKIVQDFPAVKSQLDAIEYRSLGMLRVFDRRLQTKVKDYSGSDREWTFADIVEDEARKARIEVFDETSAFDDKERSLQVADDTLVQETDTVIFTSDVEGKVDGGVLRSKISLTDPSIADGKASFVGRKVSDQFTVDVNGEVHTVTLLGVRRPS